MTVWDALHSDWTTTVFFSILTFTVVSWLLPSTVTTLIRIYEWINGWRLKDDE
jgi:hypothetical protein